MSHLDQQMDLLDRKSIRQEILNDTIEQLKLTWYFQEITSKKKKPHQNTRSFQVHIEHSLQHKTSLNKFKNTEIISSIFSDHNGIKSTNQSQKKRGKKRLHGD